MRRLDQDTINAAWRHFEKIKVFTIGQLSSFLCCSIANARLKVKQWQAYTSYNRNGKYYALPGVPRFNRHGLWHYKNVAFSKHGNLKRTVIHLVSTSSGGLSGRQLGELLGLSPRSFLHHFRNSPGIRREKHDGVFVYFSDADETCKRQLRQRRSPIRRPDISTISDPDAVMILVAVIRRHGISAEDIMAMPEIKNSKLKLIDIKGFMQFHGLLKKTPDSRR